MAHTRRLSDGRRRRMPHRWVLATALTIMLVGLPVAGLNVSPKASAHMALAPAPSWMDPDTASRLTLDFDVLVPGWIPAPFGEQPAITASGGFYELYWVITGGEPTFLDITGSAGGDIPDFSWYDRNNELQQNAQVGGIPAYRDLTPIYDNVYWEADGVVYTVSSQGLTDTDSLSLANALVLLEPDQQQSPPPSPPAPATLTAPETVTSGSTTSITVTNGAGAMLNASDGTFSDTGSASYASLSEATVSWTAPEVSGEEAVTFTLVDPDSGSWLAGATTVVTAPAPPPLAVTCVSETRSGDQVVVTVTGSGSAVVEATSGLWPAFGANLVFDPNAGGRSVAGDIAGGAATLLWQAPETNERQFTTITVSGMSGVAAASCDIAVIPGSAPAAATTVPTRPAETTATASDTSEERTDQTAESTQTSRSTATSTARTSSGGTVTRRNRPTPESVEPSTSPTRRTSPTRQTLNRFRLPESDGTGGPLHPRYVGALAGTDGMNPLPAPTNAPMPPAPRVLRSGVNTAAETAGPTATPPVIAAMSMDPVEAVFGPAGGMLRHPNGAVLRAPAGVFAASTRVQLRPVPDGALPMDAEVAMIAGTGYDIEVVDAAGRAITQLGRPVSFEVPVPAGIDGDASVVYSIETDGLAPVETVADGTWLRASPDHFSRFAVGEPRRSEATYRWMLPWVAIAGTAMLVLAASTVAGVVQRRRVVVRRRTQQDRDHRIR